MRRSRKIGLVLIAGLWLAIALWIGLEYHAHPYLTTSPMVQMAEPNRVTLVWSLPPGREATLEVTGPDGAPAGTIQLTAEDNRSVATISGLAPGTSYRYRIHCTARDRDVTLHEDTVHTAPPAGRPFRFLAFGDSGNGSADQWRVAARLAEQDADLIIHTGDLVYNVGAPEDYPAHFYRPYARLIAHIPFYPCLGNHDFFTNEGQPLLDAFILPRNGPAGVCPERDYWFDYGDVRFVAIDSNHDLDALSQRVAPWLDETLVAAGDRWKIVVFHEPVYTNGRYGPAERIAQAVIPVLDRHRVQLVLCGHNHMYERTYPLRSGVPFPPGQGTVYIVTGGGGGHLYQQQQPRPAYMAAYYDARHSFTVLDVTAGQIRLRQINDRSETVDEYLIPK